MTDPTTSNHPLANWTTTHKSESPALTLKQWMIALYLALPTEYYMSGPLRMGTVEDRPIL